MLQKFDTDQAKPFLKWVGGKRQLLPKIKKLMPKEYNDYFEPFIGGGALLFSMPIDQNKRYFINDYNEELMNVYKTIQGDVENLIADLKKHENTPEYFYETRSWDRSEDYKSRTNVERASRFIYLNKTGYNGLYRVNSKNQINVPFGKYKNPAICDEINLRNCETKLKHVTISQGDYKAETITRISKGDFIYFDPPYAPVSKTADFTSYTKDGFGDKEQLELKEYCDYLDSKGLKFMLSNSKVPLILDLYKDYEIHTVMASRAINCKSSGRGKVEEVLIRNYNE